MAKPAQNSSGPDPRDPVSLLEAVRQGADADTINRLIDDGARVNAADGDGWRPLHMAAQVGHTEAARILLDRGAEVDAPDKKGVTALALARDRKDKAMESLLRRFGARAKEARALSSSARAAAIAKATTGVAGVALAIGGRVFTVAAGFIAAGTAGGLHGVHKVDLAVRGLRSARSSISRSMRKLGGHSLGSRER